jgi:hypothetical protein
MLIQNAHEGHPSIVVTNKRRRSRRRNGPTQRCAVGSAAGGHERAVGRAGGTVGGLRRRQDQVDRAAIGARAPCPAERHCT